MMFAPWQQVPGFRFLLAILLAVVVLASTGLAQARAKVALPVTVRGTRVVVHAERGLERAAEKLAAMAEASLRRIETDLRELPRVTSIEIRLVKRQESITLVAPAGYGAPEWAAGTAYPVESVVVVAARGLRGELHNMPQTLKHELAHVALHRAVGRVPRWLTEGFAFQHAPEFSLSRSTTLHSAAVSGKLIPIAALQRSFAAFPNQTALLYAESYDFVAYLSRRGRWADKDDDGSRAAFSQFLVELAHKKTPDDAAMAAFGRNLAQLEAEWIAQLRGRSMWLSAGLVTTLLWVLGAVLLILGWRRRRKQAAQKMAQWTAEDAAADAAAGRVVGSIGIPGPERPSRE